MNAKNIKKLLSFKFLLGIMGLCTATTSFALKSYGTYNITIINQKTSTISLQSNNETPGWSIPIEDTLITVNPGQSYKFAIIDQGNDGGVGYNLFDGDMHDAKTHNKFGYIQFTRNDYLNSSVSYSTSVHYDSMSYSGRKDVSLYAGSDILTVITYMDNGSSKYKNSGGYGPTLISFAPNITYTIKDTSLPGGTYTQTCNMNTMKWDGIVLEGDCRDNDHFNPGTYNVHSKLNYAGTCTINAEVDNINGYLTCHVTL